VAAPGQDPAWRPRRRSGPSNPAQQARRVQGNSTEARELFLVHVASVIRREVDSTKELTVAEASSLIDDLQRAIKADKQREQANPSVAEVADRQAATLRTVTHPDPGATEEGFPY
jgi:hypothetical protein